MEREHPLNRPPDAPRNIDDPEELRFVALFKSVESPSPSADFTARTMRAVKREPVPAGRKALRDPLSSLLGWAAIIAAVAFSTLVIVLSHPVIAYSATAVVRRGVGVGVWLMQFRGIAAAIFDVFTTTGLAVSRAVATTEGTTGLALVAVIGALSLSGLHRLLISEGEGQRWQELS